MTLGRQDAPVTILSDGADGPRALGEAASIGPTEHVLDWFHLAMRIQHVAQATKIPSITWGDLRRLMKRSPGPSLRSGMVLVESSVHHRGPDLEHQMRPSR